MKTQIPNINMVRSAWRRVKKDIKDAIIRDLKPVKDVKAGVLRVNPTTGGGAPWVARGIKIQSHAHRCLSTTFPCAREEALT